MSAGIDNIDRLPCLAGRDAAARFAERLALVDGARRWTHAELWHQAEALASGLQRAGHPPGARVAVWMSNCAEFILISLAIEIAGLVRVPLNARYTRHEVGEILKDCEPVLIAADPPRARRLPAQAPAVISGSAQWRELERSHSPTDLYAASAGDLCSLNYTSGSTGKPKGVMLTHRNWMAVYRNLLTDRDIRQDDRLLHVGALSHASGAYFMPFFLRGAASVISEPRIGGLLRSLEREQATVFTCVPSLLTRLLADRRLDETPTGSLRQIGYGGEPMPANTLKAALEKFGPMLVPNYGLTEAMMTICTLPAEEMLSGDTPRQSALGRAYTHVDIELRDQQGRAVADGEVGELYVRGEQVMQGYWRAPERTAEVLCEDWLRTGDLARRSADGIFTLAGRSKDMLICGGFNIYPQEVAAVIASCPGVAEVAVVGLPDPNWGEIPVAFVTGTQLQQQTLLAYSRPLLGIRTPKRWEIREQLPRTLAGKIDLTALRTELQKQSRRPRR